MFAKQIFTLFCYRELMVNGEVVNSRITMYVEAESGLDAIEKSDIPYSFRRVDIMPGKLVTPETLE